MLNTIRLIATITAITCALDLAKVSGAAGASEVECVPPTRIASTSLASDEILIELLSDTPSRLLAVSPMATNQNYSNITDKIPKTVATTGADAETILALQPDLIIAAGFNRPETLDALRRSGKRVLSLTDFSSIEHIRENIVNIAYALCLEQPPLLDSFDRRRKRLESQATKNKPTLLFYEAENFLYGRNTLFDDIVKLAGANNLAAKIGIDGWQKVDPEALAALSPDYLIVGVSHEKTNHSVLSDVQKKAVWGNMNATKENQLILLPKAQLMATSHHLLTAAEALQQALRSEK